MRVTILGGAAAGPAAGMGCSGLLVTNAAASMLLDLGPGTLPELLKHTSASDIDAIVISHMHQDHWLDLIPLRYRLSYAPGAQRRKVALHLPSGGMAMLERVAAALEPNEEPGAVFSNVFEIAEFDPASELEAASFRMRFARTVHPLPCWMIRVIDSAGDLGYTADTGFDSGVSQFMDGTRCLVVEATTLDEERSVSHLSAREAGRIAADARADEVVLCHLWPELDPARIFREAQTTYGGPMHIAEPGLVVQW